MDAVNEFEGECDYYENYFYCGSRINKLNSGVIQSTLKPIYNTSWDAVCTRAQFLATVAECETNFGKLTHGEHYERYVRASKLLLARDLDKELDMDRISCYVCHVGAYPMQQYCGSCGHELLSELVPQPTPIFTQEMVDNGVLPSVGMKLMGGKVFGGEGVEQWFSFPRYIVCAHHSDGIRFFVDVLNPNGKVISEAPRVFSISSDQFKPLTPPKTDKEKLIEEFQNALHDSFGTHTADDWSSIEDIASDLFNSFLIQPLTVEVN